MPEKEGKRIVPKKLCVKTDRGETADDTPKNEEKREFKKFLNNLQWKRHFHALFLSARVSPFFPLRRAPPDNPRHDSSSPGDAEASPDHSLVLVEEPQERGGQEGEVEAEDGPVLLPGHPDVGARGGVSQGGLHGRAVLLGQQVTVSGRRKRN